MFHPFELHPYVNEALPTASLEDTIDDKREERECLVHQYKAWKGTDIGMDILRRIYGTSSELYTLCAFQAFLAGEDFHDLQYWAQESERLSRL